MHLSKRVPIKSGIFFNTLVAVLLWSLLCISSSAHFDPSILFKIFCLVLLGVTLVRPIWGIGIFLVVMPFFGGSKPHDEHTVRFFTLLSVTVFAALLYFSHRLVSRKEKFKCDFSHPLVFALFMYWVIAAFSLLTIVPNELVFSIFRFQSPLIRQFLNLSESSAVYSYLAFFALTLSLLLGILIANLAHATESALFLIRCFLFGILLTVFLGLLDYYDLVNLNSIRPWYFLAHFGEDYRFMHLTSVFGNPGWYAQYLVLGAPSLLAILGLQWQRKRKIALLIGLMLVTEFCILLIYQRGGWISYPLTLVIIWFCVYVLDDSQINKLSGNLMAAKGTLLKILISLPLTIVISLSLLYFTARVQPESRQQLSGFIQRAESITSANDRMRYWEPTFLMARLHPFFGPGLESFSSQYEKLYVAPGHKYAQTPKYNVAPYYSSAHNLYFQTLAGKGILGLISLLTVFFAVFTLVWRGILSPLAPVSALSQPQRLILMMTLAYTCALAIYGNVGEIFYSPIGYVSFILFFSASIASVPAAFHLTKNFRFGVLALIICSLLAHLYLEFGVHLWVINY